MLYPVQEGTLSTECTVSVWSTIPRLQLKLFKTMNDKVQLKVNNKMVQVREERKLFTRFLLVKEARPDLCLEDAIGTHEFSLFPRSLMDSNGNLLLPSNKAELLNKIITSLPDTPAAVAPSYTTLLDLIDGMALVNALKKYKTTLTCAVNLLIWYRNSPETISKSEF